MPYKQPSYKGSKSRTRVRAMQEIERIREMKAEKEKRQAELEQKLREASAKRKKKARDEIEKRKIELGVADKIVGIPPLALISDG